MKFLFAIKALSLSGGAERVLADLASELARRGHVVTVISYDPPGSVDFFPFDPAVRRVRLGIGRALETAGITDTARRVGALRREATRLAPDVAVGFMHSVYLPMGVALLGTGIPVIASEHTVYDHYRTRPLQAASMRLLPLVADGVTAISQSVLETFPAVIRRSMSVVPDPVAATANGRANVRGAGRRTLLTVGRLAEEKDHRTLIAAFANVAADFPDWDLRIIGEGELRAALEAQIAALDLGARVLMPGATSDVGAEYAQAQLFAIPSRYESFGLATAEAFAHGLPAVGFADCPGTNELIEPGRNGLLVSGPDRVQALAAGLRKLMSRPDERERLGAAAPKSVAPYSLSEVARTWERLAAQIVDGRKKRRTSPSA